VQQLKQRIDTGEEVYLLDVREPFEYQIANLGGKLIPLNDVPRRLAEVDRDREVIVHCKSGGRSQAAAEFLRNAGYPRVANLAGGILAWADQIDPTVRKY
jgi:adenylyltransferase/sulfurtransferase